MEVFFFTCLKFIFSGVHLVLDYGASDLQENIECCHNPGKVVIVDLHGRDSDDIDLSILQRRQVEIQGISLLLA